MTEYSNKVVALNKENSDATAQVWQKDREINHLKLSMQSLEGEKAQAVSATVMPLCSVRPSSHASFLVPPLLVRSNLNNSTTRS